MLHMCIGVGACMDGWVGKYTNTHAHTENNSGGGKFENSKIFVQIFVLPNVCDHGYYSVSTVGPHMSGPQRSSIVSHPSDIHMIIFIKNFKVNILCQSHAFKDTVYGKF